MSSISKGNNGIYYVSYRWGSQFRRSLGTASFELARSAGERIKETIRMMNAGVLTCPTDVNPGDFIFTSGRTPLKPSSKSKKNPKLLTIATLFDAYEGSVTPHSKEANSRSTERTHRKHLSAALGVTSPLETVSYSDVQGYIQRRAKKRIKTTTIRKELATLRMVWNWAAKHDLTPKAFPWMVNDFDFPKSREKEDFQTWEEIERRIASGVPAAQAKALWESLFLDEKQVRSFLDWVEVNARKPYDLPIIAMAAYTGARRSEIVRSEKRDFDFKNRTLVIRQKKSDASMEFTTRRVPIHPELARIMADWFRVHPGGRFTISAYGGDREMPAQAVTKLFRRIVDGGPWNVLRGLHVFRHSLASIMASKGTDQRTINDILGHSTKEMERRYRHMFPATQESAINSLFS